MRCLIAVMEFDIIEEHRIAFFTLLIEVAQWQRQKNKKNRWKPHYGISINSIGELLSEHDPGSVISVLLEQQENILKEEIHERQVKLDMLDGIKQELKTIENFSIESIGDIAYAMENKKKMSGARI